MHPTAYAYVANVISQLPKRERVLEMGSRDINGSVRPIFTGCKFIGIDIAPGPGADFVADAATWFPENGLLFDTIVTTEVLEHAANAREICRNAYRLLDCLGVFIVTAAGAGRAPHSAVDGGTLREGEHYQNIEKAMMEEFLSPFGFVMIDTSVPGDIYAMAVRLE